MSNHLSQSTSPYLLQHAHNPVDWYPWGEEALAKAKAEDKPLLHPSRPLSSSKQRCRRNRLPLTRRGLHVLKERGIPSNDQRFLQTNIAVAAVS